jgi:hypothetical protein
MFSDISDCSELYTTNHIFSEFRGWIQKISGDLILHRTSVAEYFCNYNLFTIVDNLYLVILDNISQSLTQYLNLFKRHAHLRDFNIIQLYYILQIN